MSEVRKVRVVAWKSINLDELDEANAFGLVVDYMDGGRVSYPVGSQLDAHREARRLRETSPEDTNVE